MMKEIQLTQGKVALVDDEDYDFLSQWKWCVKEKRGLYYAVRAECKKVEGKWRTKIIRMHRQIMNPPDEMLIDHINRNGLDNRKCNLRIVTNRQNHWNTSNQREFIGVAKHRKKYRSLIYVDGKTKCLGFFKTPEEAHRTYMEYAKTLAK